MKTITLFITLCLFSISIQAQKENLEKPKKFDISFDLAKIKLDRYELSFDYLLNKKSSLGTTISYSPKNKYFFGELSSKKRFAFSLNYKYYLSNKVNEGFYISPLITYATKTQFRYDYITRGYSETVTIDAQDVYLGINIGYKYVTKKDFFFDSSIGYRQRIYGNNSLNHTNYSNISKYTPQFSFSIGKRF